MPVVPLVAALAVGGAGGFALSRYGSEGVSKLPSSVPVTIVITNSDGSASAITQLPPGSLVPVAFADLDRELSLLKALDLALRGERVGDLARAAVIDNPTAVLSLAEAKLTQVEADQFRATIVSRWAQVDAPAALAWARRQSAVSREGLLSSVVRAWAKRDSRAALEFVAQTGETDLHRSLQIAAFSGLAEVDPERAWSLVEKIGNAGERAELAHTVLLAMVRKEGLRAARLALALAATDRNGGRTQEIVGAWLTQDPKAASEWLRTLPAGSQRSQLIMAASGDLARTHPESALELARSLPPGVLREQSVRGTFSQWVRGDADGALRWAQAGNDPILLRRAQTAAIEYWSGVDPRRAAALLSATPGLAAEVQRDGHLGQIGRQWAQRNITEAMAWAKSLPARQQAEAVPAILAAQGATNPQGALAQATALTDSRTRRVALQTVLGEWAGRDGEDAGKWLLNQSDRRLITEMAPGIIQQLAETDFAAAESLANQMTPGEARSRALAGMVGSLANANLNDAIGHLEKLPVGSARDAAMEQLAWVWGQQDPEAAAKYALSQSDTEGRARLLDAAATEWALRDPAAGTAFWKELGPGQGRDTFADNLARHWAETDPQAAAKWVTSLPPGDRQPELVARVIGAWAQQSPVEAATYAGQLPPEFQESAVRSVLDSYAEQDPSTGAKWLAAFPDDGLRNRLQAGFVNRWAQDDAVAAGEWLRLQPDGPSQQAAIEEFTRTVASREPAAAWDWAGAVANEERRFALQQQTMQAWLRIDPEAAGRALNQMEWPEDLKDDLRRRRR